MGEQRGLAPLLTVDLAPVTVELNLRESGARFPCKWSSVLEIYKKLKNALKSGLEQRCNSNFLAIFVEVILWFFDRLRKAPALLAPEPSLSLTSQVQRKF